MTTALDTEKLVSALLYAADEHVTGELSTSLPDGGPAQVFLKEGQVYGVVVRDGSRTLGELLVSGGALSREQLEYALEAQRRDVPSWRIGELLVHLGYVSPEQVQACLGEQMQEMMGWLLAQPPTPWHMRRGSRTRFALAPPIDVAWLLTALGVKVTTLPPDTFEVAPEPIKLDETPPEPVKLSDMPPEPGELVLEESFEAAPTAEAATPADEPTEDDAGMVRSDALAALSALNEDEDEEGAEPPRWVFGFLRPAGGQGKRGRRRTG